MKDDKNMENIVIVGQAEAGREHLVINKIQDILQSLNRSNFDLAELLSEVKRKGYYLKHDFNTFSEFVESLDLKVRKAQYLCRIVEVMEDLGVLRDEYEKIGISKLREITSLEPTEDYTDPGTGKITPMSTIILGLIEKANELSLTEIREAVKMYKGLVGDDELVWINFCVKKAAKVEIQRALELARANIGSVFEDEDGNAVDASDGACLEAIAIEYLNDPANEFLAGKTKTTTIGE